MTTATDAAPGFSELWQRYPWPESPPMPDVVPVGRSSAGLELLFDALEELDGDPVIMEIGAEFGGSTRRFLQQLPSASVVSVDPWPDSYGGGSFPALQPILGRPGAMYELFQSFCWEYRHRLAPVREFSPAGPLAVRDAGVNVDLVYVDGDHRYDAVIRDLTIADAMFPSALLGGDDWLLKSNAKKYEGMRVPVQLAVKSWAAFNDVHVDVKENTWLIDRSRPYNLDHPPARFSSKGSDDQRIQRIEASVKRIERRLGAPTLPRRALRKLRATIRSA